MDLPDKIRVKLKPNRSKQSIEEKNGWYHVHVKPPARDGDANEALLELLKEKTGKRYVIKHGKTSRKKLLVKF